MAVIIKTDADFEATLADNAKVVVKYYADWCGQCRLFAPKFRRMSDDDRFSDVIFVDINAEENPNARKLAGVSNLPFFATFKDGKLVEGDFTAKKEGVEKMIENIL
ncbi:MAG TPA: thioredoxin [Bacteroidetes bacterium]|nr:thioredoxin [Bacteroidota bacterium]